MSYQDGHGVPLQMDVMRDHLTEKAIIAKSVRQVFKLNICYFFFEYFSS